MSKERGDPRVASLLLGSSLGSCFLGKLSATGEHELGAEVEVGVEVGGAGEVEEVGVGEGREEEEREGGFGVGVGEEGGADGELGEPSGALGDGPLNVGDGGAAGCDAQEVLEGEPGVIAEAKDNRRFRFEQELLKPSAGGLAGEGELFAEGEVAVQRGKRERKGSSRCRWGERVRRRV